MGAFDFEQAKEEMIGNRTYLEMLNNNKDYLVTTSFKVTNTPLYSYYVLNRPVFYYTKLREDIFFINTKIITKDGVLFYTFTANDKSFFKRFSVYNEKNEKILYQDDTAENIIKRCMKYPNKMKVSLNIRDFESSELEQCTADYRNDSLKYHNYLKNGSLVVITGFVRHNKRLWLYLFNNTVIDYPNKAELGDPNYDAGQIKESSRAKYDSETGGHFDVTELEFRKKYKCFID